MSEQWTQVASKSDVPEDGTYPVTFEGEPVCLYNLEGEIFATHDICTHGNANLSDGFVVEGQIECPFHQGTFDIRTGKASAAPCSVDVQCYAVKVEGDVIWLKQA
jgi:nitrite reductase/ring-hydroxylating ferredoxin subunit